MPELPEVHTTATLLNRLIAGQKILFVETSYKSQHYFGKENIKDPKYFKKFKKIVEGKKIEKVYRRAKNVLIDLSGNQTILIHMKMTGHFLYGKYKKDKKNFWISSESGPLNDSFNKYIRLIFGLSKGKHLAFSDMRKFATVYLLPDKLALNSKFENVGPEPLEKNFNAQKMRDRLFLRPMTKIKTALMDQKLIAGIGNIYSDEILWASDISPLRKVKDLNPKDFFKLLRNAKKILRQGIDSGGDSMSDYRNPYGEKGKFQYKHKAYQRTGQKCSKKGCGGQIKKIKIDQRSAHFCEKHQK